MLKKLYLSRFGGVISCFLRFISIIHQPFMVYGFYNRVDKKFKKETRVSSNTVIINRKKLDIGNHVWIGHFSLIDSSGSVTLGEGVQTGSHVSIFTHSSHNSIRLLGKKYIESNVRIGYLKGEVIIGDYTFIGTGSVIMPNVTIGKGCLIKAGSMVNISVPDFSIVEGNPARINGSTLSYDEKYFTSVIVRENYFDQTIIENYFRNKNKLSK